RGLPADLPSASPTRTSHRAPRAICDTRRRPCRCGPSVRAEGRTSQARPRRRRRWPRPFQACDAPCPPPSRPCRRRGPLKVGNLPTPFSTSPSLPLPFLCCRLLQRLQRALDGDGLGEREGLTIFVFGELALHHRVEIDHVDRNFSPTKAFAGGETARASNELTVRLHR